ncbi:MAG: 50S ribosomal protein L4 [Thermoleophilia bacterium]
MPAAATADLTPRVPVLNAVGGSAREAELDPEVFSAEVKAHLLHQAVRAELAAERAGTRGAKSRGLVSGGRSKPWRQKGTGRARQGTIRAPQWRGGGVAFPPTMRDFSFKVNKKERRAAFRGALSSHVREGTLAVLDGESFQAPSTRQAAALLAAWGKPLPALVVVHEDEEVVARSFRNLPKVAVTVPEELDCASILWARALLVSERALPLVETRAGAVARGGLSS